MESSGSAKPRDTGWAMSEENVEIVRAVFDAQRRRDWDAFPQLYDPEIEWDDVAGLWGDWGTRRGFDDVRKAFLTWFEAFEQVEFRLEGNILQSGDDVIATQRISGRGRGSGLSVNQRITLIWTVRSGRVTRVRAFRERADALEAAGLRE
jgi:ketosteroid isomerase-like protein